MSSNNDSTTSNGTDDTSKGSSPSVAVIGGGPGAMFLCHSIEVQRNELLKKGEDVSGFPIVKCFERSGGPGGVWRSDRTHEDKSDEGDADVGADGSEADSPATNLEFSSFSEEKKEDESVDPNETTGFRDTKRLKATETATDTSEKAIASDQPEKTPNMYSALWTNGPKEAFEFSDYTFAEHFGEVGMPTFLPRKHVLQYILARCTKNCPDFFEKYFSFRTSVVNVRYLENEGDESSNRKFRVQTKNDVTGIESIETFDKCVWAGGVNGIPTIPKPLLDIFTNGGFKGSIVHSSDTANFKSDVENRRVLIIGGGYSAEDLAIMAIKEGVSRIYCTCRAEDKEISYTTRWPYDKVEVFESTTVEKVEGGTVTLQKVRRDYAKWCYKAVNDGDRTILKDIDTVIFCTGYRENFKMLDEKLQEPTMDESDYEVEVPKNWKMAKSEPLEAFFGKDHADIKPSKEIYPDEDVHSAYPDLYRGCIWIKDPNMMFFLNQFSHTPLVETDVSAWMMARCLTGQIVPSREEMQEYNEHLDLECMHNVFARYRMDRRFRKAMDSVYDESESCEQKYALLDEAWYIAEEEFRSVFQTKIIGRMMHDYGYPVKYLCEDRKSFSELGEHMSALEQICMRSEMKNVKYDDIIDEDNSEENRLSPGWKTFRDMSCSRYVSYFTGIKAIPLPKPWFDLDEDDKLW